MDRCSRKLIRRNQMKWTSPKFEEVSMHCEISTYAEAEYLR